MVIRALPLFLLACTMGPSTETLIDDLQVVGAVMEPPEVAPGEPAELDLYVADPRQTGADVLLWQCTDLGDGCVESGDPVADRLEVGTLSGSTYPTTVAPSPALAALLPDDDTRAAAGLWVLACAPGLCPVIDDARDALATGVVSDALNADLRDPVRWLADRPLDGVSLAYRSLVVSRRSDRNANPTVEVVAPEELSADPEGAVDLEVHVEDDGDQAPVVAFGLATAGGFGVPSLDVVQGEAVMTWYAPAEAGAVDLYVIIDDHEGGTAVWTGTADVR